MQDASLAGRRLLVVDDHEDTLEIMRVVLGQAGADVRTCGSPEDALTAMAAAGFDVVITDLIFGRDRRAGVRIYHVARQQLVGGLVIAMTGQPDAAPELRAMGFDLVLVKPVDPFDLVRVVADALRAR